MVEWWDHKPPLRSSCPASLSPSPPPPPRSINPSSEMANKIVQEVFYFSEGWRPHRKRNEHRAPGVTNAPTSDSPRNAAAKQHLKVVFKTENSKRGIPVAAKLGKGFDGAPDPRILSHFVTLCHTLSHRGGRAAREPLGVFWGVCGHAGSSQRHP